MRNGFYLGPAPFTAASLLPERDEGTPRRGLFSFFGRTGRGPRPSADGAAYECAAIAAYQMGCFAHLLAPCGFDAGALAQCPCERSGARCVDRLR
jgi:hypothetical protein